jgi:hypothetical protein
MLPSIHLIRGLRVDANQQKQAQAVTEPVRIIDYRPLIRVLGAFMFTGLLISAGAAGLLGLLFQWFPIVYDKNTVGAIILVSAIFLTVGLGLTGTMLFDDNCSLWK